MLQLVDFESWKTIFAKSENSGSIGSGHMEVQGKIYALSVLSTGNNIDKRNLVD